MVWAYLLSNAGQCDGRSKHDPLGNQQDPDLGARIATDVTGAEEAVMHIVIGGGLAW